jgi:hypothetical protein
VSKPKQVQVVFKTEARLVKRLARICETTGEKPGAAIEAALRAWLDDRERAVSRQPDREAA